MRWLAVVTLTAALVGCQPPVSSTDPSLASAGAEPTDAGAFPSTCHDFRVLSPNGDEVRLDGTWLGNEGAYWTFTQVGDCVWATATDKYSTPGSLDTYWQIYLRGTIRQDLTLAIEYAYSGIWPVAIAGDSHYGHAVLSVVLAPDGSTGEMTILKVTGCNAAGNPPCPSGEGTLQTTEWSLLDTDLILPPPIEQ
jgi:hypothetical protein